MDLRYTSILITIEKNREVLFKCSKKKSCGYSVKNTLYMITITYRLHEDLIFLAK